MAWYIGFFVTWITFWFGIASIFLTLWGIVLDENSQRYAISYAGDKSIAALFSRSVAWTSRFSNRFFGDRLFSIRAFGVGFLISTLVYSLAFGIMIATTQYERTNLLYEFKEWRNSQSVALMHFSFLLDFILVFFSLMMEFIYVSKSRFLLKWVNFEAPIYKTLLILIFDFLTTFLVFVVLTPALILIFGYVLFFLFHSQVQGYVLLPSPDNMSQYIEPLDPSFYFLMNGKPVHPTPASPFELYSLLAQNILTQTWQHFREGFQCFHEIKFSVTLSVPTPDHPATVEINGHQIPVIATYENYSIWFPLTTMLTSAFATLIWTTVSTLVYLLSRTVFSTILISRSVFLLLHKRKEFSLMCAFFCFWVGLIGGVAGLYTLS